MARSVAERQDTVKDRGPRGGARTPAGDALSALWVEVFQLGGLFAAAGDALARPAGQTSARWQVMAAIEDGPLTVAQIARRLRLARQSVQRVADLLADDAFATYEDNPGHRRAKLLRLTPAGRRALRAIQARQVVWANSLGAEIGEADLRRASAVLERLLRALQARRPSGT
jgi:DNA-binding MarR family transcriptional regulator